MAQFGPHIIFPFLLTPPVPPERRTQSGSKEPTVPPLQPAESETMRSANESGVIFLASNTHAAAQAPAVSHPPFHADFFKCSWMTKFANSPFLNFNY